MDFKLIVRTNANELAHVVAKYLRDGWMLRGPTTMNHGKYTQEVIRSGRTPQQAPEGDAKS